MTREIERRHFIQGAGLIAGTAALAASSEAAALVQAVSAPMGAEPKPYEAKPLPFDPKTIGGLSEKLSVSHHDNNYVGAVKRLNAINAQIAALDYSSAPGFLINGLKREQLIAMNSMILHEIYFDGLGGGGAPGGKLAKAIQSDFGSIERWQAEFTAMGKAEGGGSGWVILAYSPRDKRLSNQWAADHTTMLAGGRPVLVLDMYEHAYHIDYGAKAAAYVDAFMRIIRWDKVSKLFDAYRRDS